MDDLIKSMNTLGKKHPECLDAAETIERMARALMCMSVWARFPPIDGKLIEKAAQQALYTDQSAEN